MATYISKVTLPGETGSRALRDDEAVRGVKVDGLAPTSGKAIELSTDATTGDISINMHTKDTIAPVLSTSAYDSTKTGFLNSSVVTFEKADDESGEDLYSLTIGAINYENKTVTGIDK